MVRIPRRFRKVKPHMPRLMRPTRPRDTPAYELIRRLASSHELICLEVAALRRAVRVVMDRTGSSGAVLRERDRLDDLDDRLQEVDEELRRCKGV